MSYTTVCTCDCCCKPADPMKPVFWANDNGKQVVIRICPTNPTDDVCEACAIKALKAVVTALTGSE